MLVIRKQLLVAAELSMHNLFNVPTVCIYLYKISRSIGRRSIQQVAGKYYDGIVFHDDAAHQLAHSNGIIISLVDNIFLIVMTMRGRTSIIKYFIES